LQALPQLHAFQSSATIIGKINSHTLALCSSRTSSPEISRHIRIQAPKIRSEPCAPLRRWSAPAATSRHARALARIKPLLLAAAHAGLLALLLGTWSHTRTRSGPSRSLCLPQNWNNIGKPWHLQGAPVQIQHVARHKRRHHPPVIWVGLRACPHVPAGPSKE